VFYGTYGGWRQSDTDLTHVWTSASATIFLKSEAKEIGIPIKAPFVRRTGPVTVDIYLNSRPVHRAVLKDRNWTRVAVVIPDSRHRYQELEFKVAPTYVPQARREDPDAGPLGIMIGKPSEG
jgi:hypothetical protein